MSKKTVKNIDVYRSFFRLLAGKKALKIILVQQMIMMATPTIVSANDVIQPQGLAKNEISTIEKEPVESSNITDINEEIESFLSSTKNKNIFIKEVSLFYGIDEKIVGQEVEALINTTNNHDDSINYDSILLDKVEESIVSKNVVTDGVSTFAIGTNGQEKVNEIKNSPIGAIYNKYGNMYGVDSNLLIARDMQESGLLHDSFDSSGAYGISQIENTLFNSSVHVFNFETNSYEDIVITENGAKELDTNIRYGACKMQEKLRNYGNNIFVSLQAYNYGSSINIVLDNYAASIGSTREQVINNKSDFGWLSYVDEIHYNPSNYINWDYNTYGDNLYISNVMRYMSSDIVSIKNENGMDISYNLKTNQVINVNEGKIDTFVDKLTGYKKVLTKNK